MQPPSHPEPHTSEAPLKKRYVKPEIRQVPLRPEEAVLGNCKTAGVSGPGSAGTCSPGAIACSSLGS
ncbi:hypothetical protein [Candidatus Entotheonella palauensis]|uniref:hypothetical protein n=1 Tax=Candidatus Entotheonella palauensis TaxID=93172 RepID=UPI0004B7CD49|nr:hypothetical protein [Candidatus Entotheonella palauensis]